ncbi:tumor necrosis factor receptor superfamily member 6 [Rhinichthys klamathensis goyatoka]|uniref:tumor necrosis factor receptor superfamily member 6 n=1 Tax=Rhinichthys klamathensis goyatoka TaxID=3034132 RepID=UPI0024B4842C|nr:tumor necrosis factor receptor superfamily member 6 [Rhinichthys klamathensis goyatoka]
MYVWNIVAFLCCVIFAVGLTGGRRMRKRRDTCDQGTYQHEGNTCCLCPKGYRVSRDCTDKNITGCNLCESNTYLDHPNNDYNCQPCKICDSSANMEEKERCSPFSNTVCRCKEDHYCDQGDQCRICKPCDTCEEVKTKCTETNNTVCKDAKDTSMSNGILCSLNTKYSTGGGNGQISMVSSVPGAIAAAVLVPLFIIIICMVLFYVWKQKKDKKSRDKVPKEQVPLKDLDLNPHLFEIADHLGWKVMKRVALHCGMTKAYIDNHECNHPNDARERTYGLLQDWSQKQGLYEAYPALIRTLHAIKERRTADEIKKIVEKEQAETQP